MNCMRTCFFVSGCLMFGILNAQEADAERYVNHDTDPRYRFACESAAVIADESDQPVILEKVYRISLSNEQGNSVAVFTLKKKYEQPDYEYNDGESCGIYELYLKGTSDPSCTIGAIVRMFTKGLLLGYAPCQSINASEEDSATDINPVVDENTESQGDLYTLNVMTFTAQQHADGQVTWSTETERHDKSYPLSPAAIAHVFNQEQCDCSHVQ